MVERFCFRGREVIARLRGRDVTKSRATSIAAFSEFSVLVDAEHTPLSMTFSNIYKTNYYQCVKEEETARAFVVIDDDDGSFVIPRVRHKTSPPLGYKYQYENGS